MSNISLYDTDDEKNDITPSNFSDFGFCYISRDDFLSYRNERVKIYFDDNKIKYYYRNDLHLIKTELYTTNPLYLMDIDTNTTDTIYKICEKIINNFDWNQKYKKKKIFTFDTKKKIIKLLTHYYCTKKIGRMDLFCSEIQVLSAYEACKLFLLDDDKSKRKKDKKTKKRNCSTNSHR